MKKARKYETKKIVEIFGFDASDIAKKVREYWHIGKCPFTNFPCIKHNHDRTIIYGTCSVSSAGEDVIICPNRLYAENYKSIRRIADEAFGEGLPFLSYDDFLKRKDQNKKCVVALGQYSGSEVRLGKLLSMDWILALVENGKLEEYVGIEVQSIDTTGNYRNAWLGHKNLEKDPKTLIPPSGHGLNWANVHKRLIPQLIRKGIIYSRSKHVKKGLYFIVPDAVYKKFEEILGFLPNISEATQGSITVHSYSLGPKSKVGKQRQLVPERTIRFSLKEFSERFIEGSTLPLSSELDKTVKEKLKLL